MIKLSEKYKKDVVPAMMEKFGYTNVMAVPRIEKVVVNTGFGKLVGGKTGEELAKTREAIVQDISQISGQRAVLTKARASISEFGVRKGIPIGAKVTLRGKRMHDFLDRLIHVVLPRSRDFRGLPATSFDERGNFNIGIEEHIFFPEISPEKAKHIIGLQITIATTAKNAEEGRELLKLLGFPMKGQE